MEFHLALGDVCESVQGGGAVISIRRGGDDGAGEFRPRCSGDQLVPSDRPAAAAAFEVDAGGEVVGIGQSRRGSLIAVE